MKNWLYSTILIFSLFPLKLFAEISAHRDPGIDSRVYEEEFFGRRLFERSTGKSALSRAEILPTEALPPEQRWNASNLQKRFETLRDHPIVEGKWTPSWRYPEDGCFARASLANKTAFHHYYPLPGKVFAFGNLTVETSYSPRGRVSWWFHVAPIVEVEGEKYVLDPAIEFTRPLPLTEWLSRMGDASSIRVSFCGSGTYGPSDNCDDQTDGLEMSALSAQKYYLKLEAPRR